MRRLALSALALAAAGLMTAQTPARAQSFPGPAALLLKQQDHLQLTDEQVRQLETMRERQGELFARQDSARRAARDETLALLTPEQKEKVEELRRRHRAHRHERARGRRHRPVPSDSIPG